VLGDSKLIGFNKDVNEPPVIDPSPVRPRKLSRLRMAMAMVVALVADGIQLVLGPVGWVFGDQIIDAVTAILVSWLLGFHWLLLPTFVVELVPVAGEIPTWTGCVIAVIALRKREQRRFHESSAPPGPTIDV